MRHLILETLFCCVIIFLPSAHATTIVSDNLVRQEWRERVYRTTLPAPFNEVEIYLSIEDEKIKRAVVVIGDSRIEIDHQFLLDIDSMAEPEILVSRNRTAEKQAVEEIRVMFPTMKLIMIGPHVTNDGDCGDEIDWANELKVFTISLDGNVTVTRIDPTTDALI